jgi:hypothetical protein
MYESSSWDSSRYTILIVVLAVHLALVILLASASRTGIPIAASERTVQLLFLPPVIPPKVRSESGPPGRLSHETVIAAAPPVLDSILPSSPSSSTSDGRGSGVDWAAEARRALQAYEIRNHRPPSNSSVSGGPAEEHWWPRGNHRVGEQYKTANGDWIVWINDNCYQIAVAGPNTTTPGTPEPQTICPPSSNAASSP